MSFFRKINESGDYQVMRTNLDFEREIVACFLSYGKLRLKARDMKTQRDKEEGGRTIAWINVYRHTHLLNM